MITPESFKTRRAVKEIAPAYCKRPQNLSVFASSRRLKNPIGIIRNKLLSADNKGDKNSG